MNHIKHTDIPAGYRLTVVSWENDADNYNTEILEGQTLERTKFLVDLCQLMSNDEAFCNLYEPTTTELDLLFGALANVVIKHFPNLDKKTAVDHGMNHLYDLGLCGGEFFTRVCESFKVEHLPVAIQIQDVTEQFK